MRGLSGNRLAWGIFGVVVLVVSTVVVTLAVSARPAPAASSPPAATAGSGTVAGLTGAAGFAGTGAGPASQGSAVTYPVWCCSGGSPLGLTVVGEASVFGGGTAARASAIASAVADARNQAIAAARAAGVSLGRIIDIQVSVPAYPYPLPLRAAAGTVNPAAPAARGVAASRGPIKSCPVGAMCAHPVASSYATVTITWAIG